MSDYTAKQINDMEAAFGGGFVKARAELGVTSFGMQVIRMPADYNDYPEHDHEHDKQEEVYLALKASAWISTRTRSCGSPVASSARPTRVPTACRCS